MEVSSAGSLTVLLAEDDEDLRQELAGFLRGDGYHVIEACDGRELMANLACAYLHGSESAFRLLLITDLRLPRADSFSVIRAFRSQGRQLNFVLMTAFGDPEVHAEAVRLGALAMLDKPFELGELRGAIARLQIRVRY
jgi:DNA-binding response OmpR family regulator